MAVIINSKTKKMTLVESAGQTGKSTKRFRIKDYLLTPIEHSITIALAEDRSNIEEENEKHIKRYIRQRKSEKRDYRVLIVDFKDSYIGTKITLDEIDTFKNKVAIVGYPKMTKVQRKELVNDVCLLYGDGLLIIDGCHELFLGKLDISIIGCLVTNRTHSLDIILGFGDNLLNISPKIMENMSYLRLHYIKEVTDLKVRNRLFNPQIFEVAQAVILNQYNEGFVVIDMEQNKIFSCTEKEYVDGISGTIVDRASFVTTLKGLEAFPIADATKYFLKQKHIPISNIYRDYQKNHG